MAKSIIDAHGDIVQPGTPVLLRCALDTRTLLTHGVIRPGYEQQRQIAGDLGRAAVVDHGGSEFGEGSIAANREHPATDIVGDVSIDDGIVRRDPIEICLGIRDGFCKGTHAQIIDKAAPVGCTLHVGTQVGNQVAKHRKRQRRLAGSAEHNRSQALGIARDVAADDEAAHRVAEKDIGDVFRVAVADQLPQFMHILDEDILATLDRHMPQLGVVRNALTVSDVVIGADDVTYTIQVGGEFPVALAIFRRSVCYLDDALGVCHCWPQIGMDLIHTIK